MKKQILAALAIGCAFAVQPASAAQVCAGLGCAGDVNDFTYVVGSGWGASNVNGATGYNATVGVGGPGATFTSSSDNLNVAPVAFPGGLSITATGETIPAPWYAPWLPPQVIPGDLDQLSFALEDGYTFTSAYFNLTPNEGSDWFGNPGDFVTLHYSSGGSDTVGLHSGWFGADNWFGITTSPGETLTGLSFTGSPNGDGWNSLASLKLAGLGAPGAVPEPSTWLMMILGFGLVGGALRRQQRQTARIRFA